VTDLSVTEVRDEHIAALRLLLNGNPEAARLETTADDTDVGYALMVHSAFVVAVRRRFSPVYTRAQVARYVADLRIFLGQDATQISPHVAENMVRAALGDVTLREREPYGADPSAMASAQLCVLADLVHRARLDDAGLEEFLRESAQYAKRWLMAHQTT
jgi:hypothetical protein